MSFKGDLSTIGLAEVFQMISMSQKEGTLIVQDAESRKAIYFGKEGVQLLSSGKRKGFRIGDLLVRAGKISVGQLREVLEKQEASKRLLGEELIDAGIVTQEDIEEVVRSQIEEEIYDLFLWKKAGFEFIEGPPIDELRDPDSRAIRLALDVNGLLLEAVRRTDEWSIINQKIPSMDCVYCFVSDAAKAEEESQAGDAQRAIYTNIDGQATVNDIIEASLVPRFEVCKTCVELLDRGRIRMLTAPETAAVAKQRLEEGRREKGFRLFQVAVLLAPEDPDLIGTYAHALETEGMIQDAARMYVRVGNLLKAQGQGKDALAYFQRAVSLNPDDAQSKAALFEINIASGNIEEALAAATEVVSNAMKEKDYQAAKQIAEQAVGAAPQNTDMRLSLAKVYHALDMKAERDEVISYLRKNLPVDQSAADRILGEVQQMSEQPREAPRLIMTSTIGKPAASKGRGKVVALIVGVLLVLGGAGFFAKVELDARQKYSELKRQSRTAEAANEWAKARSALKSIEGAYPYAFLTLEEMKKDVAELDKREALAKKVTPVIDNPPIKPEDEKEKKRKEAIAKCEKLLSEMVQFRQQALHEQAIAAARELMKAAAEFELTAYTERAKAVEKELTEYLARAQEKFDLAQKLEKEGKYAESASLVHELREFYFSTPVAQSALYPLCIRVKPKRVQVLRDGQLLFEGEEKVLHIGARETFTLRFVKESFVEHEVRVEDPRLGLVTVVLDTKKEKWSWAWGMKPQAAPESLAGRIYAAGEQAVVAMDSESGKVKWQQGRLQPAITTAPRFHPAGLLYVGCGRNLMGLDPARKEGEAVVFTFTADAIVSSPPAFSSDGSYAYFGCEDGKFYAVDLRAGAEPLVWKVPLAQKVTAEPIEVGGVLYLACTDGTLYAYKLGEKEPAVLWKFPTGGVLDAAPYLAGNTLYVASRDRNVYAVDAAKGTELWRAAVGGEIQSSPVLAGNRLLVACMDKSIYAFDTGLESPGKRLWSFPTRGAVTASPVVVGSQVLFGSRDHLFYCLDLATGQKEWHFETLGPIRHAAARGDGVVYFGSDDQKIYAVPIDRE